MDTMPLFYVSAPTCFSVLQCVARALVRTQEGFFADRLGSFVEKASCFADEVRFFVDIACFLED